MTVIQSHSPHSRAKKSIANAKGGHFQMMMMIVMMMMMMMMMTMMIFSFIITVNIHFNWNSDVTVAVAVVVMVLFGSSWLDYCDVIILCGCGCRGGMKWTGTVDWSTRSCPVWQRCACARRPPAPAHALCGAS